MPARDLPARGLKEQITADGYGVLRNALGPGVIQALRENALGNLHLMGRTRSQDHAYHMAGFHRFAAFEPCVEAFEQNSALQEFFASFFEGEDVSRIGLTDITINRSQHWHTDLLRGPYAGFLKGVDVWENAQGDCIKALVYLQSGKSLRILAGSHRQQTPLDDGELAELALAGQVQQLELSAGDIVLMDIRALHRGSTDQEMSNPALMETPKVLISEVYGRAGSPLTEAMRAGNAARMADWDSRFLPAAV